MNLQIINNTQGQPEYALLPYRIYQLLRDSIDKYTNDEYVKFDPSDYSKNPVALLRLSAKITQEELAAKMGVTQAYISKIEDDNYKVTKKLADKVKLALKECECVVPHKALID